MGNKANGHQILNATFFESLDDINIVASFILGNNLPKEQVIYVNKYGFSRVMQFLESQGTKLDPKDLNKGGAPCITIEMRGIVFRIVDLETWANPNKN